MLRIWTILACGAVLAASLLAGRARAADLLDTVRASHVLSIGTSNDAPLSYIDSKTNDAAGVLPDIPCGGLTRVSTRIRTRGLAIGARFAIGARLVDKTPSTSCVQRRGCPGQARA